MSTRKGWQKLLRDVGDFIVLIGRIILAFFSSGFGCLIPKAKKSVKDEIVLITGAGRGLGKELALKFIEEDAIVVLWDIDGKSAFATRDEIRSLGGKAHAYICDVTNEKEVQRIGRTVQEEVGDVTILVNNAGILQNVLFMELDSGKIRKTLEVNLLSHFWTIRFFLPRMLELEKGHIAAISSASGLISWLYLADYTASKFGILGLMEVLEEEMRLLGKEDKIHFTTACPFTIDTGMNHSPTSRMQCLCPILDVKKTAADIVTAIQREKTLITVPSRMLYPLLVHRLLPKKVKQLICDFCQYNMIPNNASVDQLS
ncbi:17-beta-hydroxysteroid dehydrogenase 13-like [Uloborus diversus]|uniref:17-beta-hydroxysteroid dehydrogenase 13-like n=1 Tax=Uloborus diversus TaxID=327109 RepID=UPI00240A2E04|nr:17-beta-hydroxysteroid dehydrogenase 13-like [Uloborus diversus]